MIYCLQHISQLNCQDMILCLFLGKILLYVILILISHHAYPILEQIGSYCTFNLLIIMHWLLHFISTIQSGPDIKIVLVMCNGLLYKIMLNQKLRHSNTLLVTYSSLLLSLMISMMLKYFPPKRERDLLVLILNSISKPNTSYLMEGNLY